MVLTYFLYDFEMVPVAPIITGITSGVPRRGLGCSNPPPPEIQKF
jgi:hypothetical protein